MRMPHFITRQKTVSRKASPDAPPRYGENSTHEDTLGNWLVYLFFGILQKSRPQKTLATAQCIRESRKAQMLPSPHLSQQIFPRNEAKL